MPLEVECAFCGATVSKPPSRVERADNHFCNRECHDKWRKGRGEQITLQCDFCGTEYKRFEWSLDDDQSNYFCSTECRGKWLRENRPETECTYCGATIKRPKSALESAERHFCDRECLWNWQQETATYDWKSTPNYGPSWKERREEILERDNRTCQGCGRDEEEIGYTPRVHHIRPFTEFDEDQIDIAHHPSNLVALCEQCHRRWEGIPLRPKLL